MTTTLEERRKIGREAQSKYPDNSWCGCCYRPWPICKEHLTDFGGRRSGGCFALCEECWEELTPEERLPFYKKVYELWRSFGLLDYNGQPWEDVWELMKSAVLAGK